MSNHFRPGGIAGLLQSNAAGYSRLADAPAEAEATNFTRYEEHASAAASAAERGEARRSPLWGRNRGQRVGSAPPHLLSCWNWDGEGSSQPCGGAQQGGATPLDRWRSKVDDVIAMNRTTSTYKPGCLPGVDVKRQNYDQVYGTIQDDCTITFVDYSRDHVNITRDLTPESLPEFLARPRPQWGKVRWVNVVGLNWEVVQQLASSFDLHPLAVEDVLHVPQRIKADFYVNHLYACLTVITLDGDVPTPSGELPAAAPPLSPPPRRQLKGTMSLRRLRTRLAPHSGAQQKRASGSGRGLDADNLQVPLSVEQASLLLLEDGTLISVFQDAGARVTSHILEGLQRHAEGFKTLVAESEDASFLLNCLADAVVDTSMPVVQVYATRIAALEAQVLSERRPAVRHTQDLHMLANDLSVLCRMLAPTQGLIRKLRAQQDGRAGLISQLTRTYLSDVLDHISTVVEDMEALAMQARDLIDLIFNTLSHSNNASMQVLANISTLFLPITFIAGVYGTNFQGVFPEIHWQYGYLVFWAICCGCVIAVMLLLRRMGMWST